MNGQLFRKKSLDRVSSPEQLNDYIRVLNPNVWMVLAAVIIFLVGVCVWGIFGHLDTVIKTAGECRGGVVTCYVKESDISAVQTGMEITVDGKTGTVTDVGTVPVEVTEDIGKLDGATVAGIEMIETIKASGAENGFLKNGRAIRQV